MLRPITSVEDALALREQVELAERFEPLASAGAHTIAQFTDAELRACLLDVTTYADRVKRRALPAPGAAGAPADDRDAHPGSLGSQRDGRRSRR